MIRKTERGGALTARKKKEAPKYEPNANRAAVCVIQRAMARRSLTPDSSLARDVTDYLRLTRLRRKV